ncbi:hypothetical protein M758_1G042800 [Ceratodon purpureus]|nr:hypothetical protein M758_1G042800 [Ceratodon purpureus]
MILLHNAESRKRGCLLERLSTVACAFANYEDNARFVLLSVSWTHLKMPLRICLLRNAITTICRAESGRIVTLARTLKVYGTRLLKDASRCHGAHSDKLTHIDQVSCLHFSTSLLQLLEAVLTILILIRKGVGKFS